jgi:TDG/mug DNA glycosylase family protein
MSETGAYDFPTLPDLLAVGLRVVFVGINPSVYAVRRGHYFARKTNRFWPGFSRSRLSAPARFGLGRDVLVPEDDTHLVRFGFGFTDVVKRPTNNAAMLSSADYAAWTPRLAARLDRYAPVVACFHGVTGFRAFLVHWLGVKPDRVTLGPQAFNLGRTRVYVVPNPSPANAHFRLEDQIHWYDRLAGYMDEVLDAGF